MAEEIKKTEKTDKTDKTEKKEKVKLGVKIKKFFKDYKSELKKIVWPTKAQLIRNTTVVLVAIIFMATVIGILDLGFGFGISRITLIKGLFGG